MLWNLLLSWAHKRQGLWNIVFDKGIIFLLLYGSKHEDRIIETCSLEKTFMIIKSNHKRNTARDTKKPSLLKTSRWCTENLQENGQDSVFCYWKYVGKVEPT